MPQVEAAPQLLNCVHEFQRRYRKIRDVMARTSESFEKICDDFVDLNEDAENMVARNQQLDFFKGRTWSEAVRAFVPDAERAYRAIKGPQQVDIAREAEWARRACGEIAKRLIAEMEEWAGEPSVAAANDAEQASVSAQAAIAFLNAEAKTGSELSPAKWLKDGGRQYTTAVSREKLNAAISRQLKKAAREYAEETTGIGKRLAASREAKSQFLSRFALKTGVSILIKRFEKATSAT